MGATTTKTAQTPALDYDPLDMNSYSLNKMPKRPLTPVGKFFRVWGLPIAAVLFVLTAYVFQFPILNPKQQIMFGLFATALFLWVSEAVPNYVTSMLLICGLILTGTLKAKPAMATLGDPVIWLNISAFVMASAMVKTDLCKRAALWLILRFGKNAGMIFITFLAINIILAALLTLTSGSDDFCSWIWFSASFSSLSRCCSPIGLRIYSKLYCPALSSCTGSVERRLRLYSFIKELLQQRLCEYIEFSAIWQLARLCGGSGI